MTPTYKKLLRALKLDCVYGLDAETYWDSKYTLRTLATTEYVCDPRFEGQIVSVQKDSWTKPKVMEWGAFKRWSKTIDWSRTGMLAHHAHFDGYVFQRHVGFEPAFYFDTLSMARAVMPVNVPRGLDSLAKALGLKGKVRGGILEQTKGKRWHEFTKEEKAEHKLYAGDDIADTWAIFLKLLEFFPEDELRLINETVGLYAKPRLLLDKSMIEGLVRAEVERKQKRIDALKVTVGDLQSNDRFAELLEALGVDPPQKYSEKQGCMVWAFSKQDQAFKDLLEHDNDAVCSLVEARLDVKSTMVESRARRLAARADYGPQPIYLNYWGAGPGRWSGGDKANWQNLKRKSELRKAIMAPPGYSLVIADLSQIEARINAWFAGQLNIVDAFANGEDVYKLAAALIYNKPVDKITGEERFIGKTAVLGLGYGAGWQKFVSMLRIGALGPPVNISDTLGRDIHRGWRQSNQFIVANWKATENKFRGAMTAKCRNEDRVVAYEGTGKHGFMHMPGGMAIRYDHFSIDEDGQMRYMKKYRVNKTKPPTILYGKLYGGLLVENRTQGLARQVVAEHALNISDELKYWKLAMTTHDELVGLVPTRYANRALKAVQKIMSTPPTWAPDLPLAVDAHISQRYDK